MHLRSPEHIRRPGRALWLRWAFASAFLLFIFIARAPRASAELFQYSTAPPAPATTMYTSNSVTATVTLIPVSSDPGLENLDPTGVGTDIVFGRIQVTGLTHNFLASQPVSIHYEFDVTIQDYGTNPGPLGALVGSSLPLAIKGIVSGTIGPGNKVNIDTNTYDLASIGPVQIGSSDFYTIHLGDAPLGSTYTHPGLGPNNLGSFGAHVTEITRTIPEPGTLTLFALGILSLALPALRRWRHKPRSSG